VCVYIYIYICVYNTQIHTNTLQHTATHYIQHNYFSLSHFQERTSQHSFALRTPLSVTLTSPPPALPSFTHTHTPMYTSTHTHTTHHSLIISPQCALSFSFSIFISSDSSLLFRHSRVHVNFQVLGLDLVQSRLIYLYTHTNTHTNTPTHPPLACLRLFQPRGNRRTHLFTLFTRT